MLVVNLNSLSIENVIDITPPSEFEFCFWDSQGYNLLFDSDYMYPELFHCPTRTPFLTFYIYFSISFRQTLYKIHIGTLTIEDVMSANQIGEGVYMDGVTKNGIIAWHYSLYIYSSITCSPNAYFANKNGFATCQVCPNNTSPADKYSSTTCEPCLQGEYAPYPFLSSLLVLLLLFF